MILCSRYYAQGRQSYKKVIRQNMSLEASINVKVLSAPSFTLIFNLTLSLS